MLTRYWIEFNVSIYDDSHKNRLLVAGCGVTAYDLEDALHLIQKNILEGNPLPEVAHMTENIDISTLDVNHIRPNMGNIFTRGIWFPQR